MLNEIKATSLHNKIKKTELIVF